MLTIEDCIALSDLTEEEILVIRAHEHLPEMAAVELGSYLCHTPDGCVRIKGFIRDAQARGNLHKAVRLKLILRHFVAEHHPGA